MKQILLSTILIFLVSSLSAQVTISLKPQVVMMDVDPAEFETVAHSFITNTSSEEKTFRWYRTIEEISQGWQNAICDINACYSVETDTTPVDFLLTLAPGDSSMLDVHIRPFGLDGSAKIKVTIFDVADTANQVTGEYLFNQTTPTRDVKVEGIKIFPNPAIDYFELSDYKDVRELVISNLIGNELRRYNVYPGAKFDVGFLPGSIYLVRLLNGRRDVIKTLRLKKR
ncbi:MAG: hypothetical protein HKN76_04055 [Saprospiraceae bacterium]|nr:hypothetical protein [Saprospiraceae bacterium]